MREAPIATAGTLRQAGPIAPMGTALPYGCRRQSIAGILILNLAADDNADTVVTDSGTARLSRGNEKTNE
jgi:hypothetical protein